MSQNRKQITFDLSQEALEAHYPRGERAQSEHHYRKAYQDMTNTPASPGNGSSGSWRERRKV